MDSWFKQINSGCALPADALRDLHDLGFVIIPGPIVNDRIAQLAQAYDLAVATAAPPDLSVGNTTTRVHDLVNRGAAFDELYVYRPILEACCRVIKQPFKLSSLLARTLRPRSQRRVPLHVDFRADTEGWPMVGFIVMVDEFRADNGATRFVPGSHKWPSIPADVMKDPVSAHEGEVTACGPAGSVIIYNGSVWHGHGANRSGQPRRSIQGAYIRRDAKPAIDQAARILAETRARIGPLAEYLLGL